MATDVTLLDRLYARFKAETSLPERACRDIARMAAEEFEGVEEKAGAGMEPGAAPVADVPEAEPAVAPSPEA